MIFTDQLQFPCPESTDYAALPIYMQRLAEQIEAQTIAQRALISTFSTPPTAIWNGPQGVLGGAPIQLFATQSDLVYANYTMPQNFGGTPEFGTAANATFNSSGIWHIGISLQINSTGAVTNDSFRQMKLVVYKQTAGGIQIVETWGRRILAESTIASDFYTASTVVSIDTEFQKYGILGYFTHGNGTAMQIPAAGQWAWVTRIGSTDTIEVVA